MISLLKKIYSGAYNRHLFAGTIGLFCLYSFFIVSAVVAINQRKDLGTDIRTTQSSVSDLEINYFNLASQVDVNKATQLGFVNDPVPEFAYVGGQDNNVAMAQ